MLRAAPLKDLEAAIEPLPFVERTHAWPRSDQTESIWGMFGIGTPPFDAALNCASTLSVDPTFALPFAGGLPFAAASCVCALGFAMTFVTRSLAAESTPCAAANFVTMKPWTPRNGTEACVIAGTWITLNDRPLLRSVSAFHGPVTQKAVSPLRKAFCAAPPSTLELIRPSLFHLSISFAFLSRAGLATPMSFGFRVPAFVVPKT